ncbi:MAG: phenylalanine 4-monooxygenase [Oligoflexia bacterium]|nr:phenylalanine 4-monooxygenase [Oligoflexia bacterium]
MHSLPIGQTQKNFGTDGLECWKSILSEHSKTRSNQVYELFDQGITRLGIEPNQIPDVNEINRRLEPMTGWRGILVNGLEEGSVFYKMLANRLFPIGNFIRDKKDLSYTPEPDIVHDLYGHLPFLTDKKYADFCQKLGEAACRVMDRPDLLRQYERFFWFTVEFALVNTPKGNRIFGAGIASSIGECTYALSKEPELLPFDVDTIRKQEFRIDQMQAKLFLLESPEQLYESLNELISKVENDR